MIPRGPPWNSGITTRGIPLPPGWRGGDHGSVIEILRIFLGVLVVASLAAIVAYALAFLGVAAWTVLTRSQRDPLRDELDRVLAEIVGPRGPGVPAATPGGPLAGAGHPGRRRERVDPFAAGRSS